MKTIFLAWVLLLNLSPAWACSCVEERISEKAKIAKARAQASLVFTGCVTAAEVVEMTDTAHLRARAGQDTVVTTRQQYRRYTFAVIRQLKGHSAATSVVVFTAGPGSSCGVSYRVGAELVVFAYMVDAADNLRGGTKKIPPYFVTGLCTRTKDLRSTKPAELRQLKRLAHQG